MLDASCRTEDSNLEPHPSTLLFYFKWPLEALSPCCGILRQRHQARFLMRGVLYSD